MSKEKESKAKNTKKGGEIPISKEKKPTAENTKKGGEIPMSKEKKPTAENTKKGGDNITSEGSQTEKTTNPKTGVEKKKWCISDQVAPTIHYYTTRRETSQKIITDFQYGSLVGYHGHSQAGKTTLFYENVKEHFDQQPNWRVIWMDASSFSIKKWESVLLAKLGIENPEQWGASHLFQDAFLDKNKPILFIIDEIQALLDQPEAVHFLSVLRTLHQTRVALHHGFAGLIAFGLYNLKLIQNLGTSCFVFDKVLPFPAHYTKAEYIELVEDYEKEASVNLNRGPIDHIFDITQGHPGLVSILLENYTGGPKEVEWYPYYVSKAFIELVTESNTVTKITSHLTNNTRLSEFIQDTILVSSSYKDGPSEETKQLLVLGFVVQNNDGEYQIAAPLFRSIFAKFVGLDLHEKPPLLSTAEATVALSTPQTFVQYLVKRVLPFMRCPQIVSKAGSKKCDLINSSTGDSSPSEYCYHFAMYTTLNRSLERSTYYCDSEVMLGGNYRADIIIESSSPFILELGANMNRASHTQHSSKTRKQYGKRLGVKDRDKLWVINFITDPALVQVDLFNDINAHSIFVWHDQTYEELKVFHEFVQTGEDVNVVSVIMDQSKATKNAANKLQSPVKQITSRMKHMNLDASSSIATTGGALALQSSLSPLKKVIWFAKKGEKQVKMSAADWQEFLDVVKKRYKIDDKIASGVYLEEEDGMYFTFDELPKEGKYTINY